jgi:hypothetical protein
VSDEAPPDNRIPRGALIVVAVGLVACLAAAVLANDKLAGSATEVEWVEEAPMADSKPVSLPDGSGKMQLEDGLFKASGTNASDYELYRVSTVLRIDAGSRVGSARINCTMKATEGTEVGQTPNSRASYPRSSESLFAQELPETVLVDFSSKGAELAVLDFTDLFQEGFSSERGVKLEWPEHVEGEEGWQWFLPPGPPKQDLVLPFGSVWRTTTIPAAKVACTVTTGAGKATVRTEGKLDKRSEPIDEEEDEESEGEDG